MLPRGAERPKRDFSCFRVARKDQKEIFHASAWRGKTKKRFSCFRVAQKDQMEDFHASAWRGKAKWRIFVLPRGAERPK